MVMLQSIVVAVAFQDSIYLAVPILLRMELANHAGSLPFAVVAQPPSTHPTVRVSDPVDTRKKCAHRANHPTSKHKES